MHLNKSNGLSHNRVTCALTDKNGLLWIGTVDGLNSYDGNIVKNFYHRNYPGLTNSGIVRMVLDTKNRIWIQCRNGQLSLLDEKRVFHAINIREKGKKVTIDYLLPLEDKTMFLSGGRIFELLETDSIHFAPVQMQEDPLFRNTFKRINRWEKNRLVFSGNDLLFFFDSKTLKTSKPIRVPFITAAVKSGTDEAIVTTSGKDRLCKISLASGKIIKRYPDLKDQYDKAMHPSPESIYHLQDQWFFITSPTAGVYVFDAKHETLKRYMHNPVDNNTLISNSSAYIFSDSSGFFFITTHVSGLDYFKFNSNKATVKPVFQDKITGKLYDGFVGSIARSGKGNLWLGGADILMEWNHTTGQTIFHNYNKGLASRGAIRTLYIDKRDRIWLGTSNGIIILDPDRQPVKYLSSSGANALPDNTINKISPAPDGRLWVCTLKGICFIDPESFKVTLPGKDSPLKAVNGKYCTSMFFGSGSEVWIGTWEGAYRLDLSIGTTIAYTTENGLLHNNTTGFADDSLGNFYIATRFGFHILEPGKALRAYHQINNAWPIDVHSLVKDKSGNIWIANNDYLACYSPVTKKFKLYDERAGVDNSGFYFFAAHATTNGELIFGSNKGITYFYPENINVPDLPLSVMINGMETIDSLYHFTNGGKITLPFQANSVSFSFSAVNLLKINPVFYQFMLEGADETWTKTSSAQRVSYNKLPAGEYLFRVKASADGLLWVEAPNPFTFQIKTPWWRSRWFSPACLLAGILVTVFFLRLRRSTIRRQQEQLETEQAINYLSSSIYEQRTVENILWDVAKNCIARLNFEDCVIYLKDEKRNVLMQKAALGPKTTGENKILNPLEIPIGTGIVGSVAHSGKAEIINDTTKDKRYIVDDERRFSEITVPIVYNGMVLGIIDSEHPRKKFFTGKHLSILGTIASLCANKIIRLKAEEETRKAQLELLRHERETVEAQLKSLRLQMNPHFLFNSLNSIQQMILAGEDTAATRYLSKFSRLLRLVLVHSDKETITLKEELVTLGLYVELEALRFKEAFRYNIACDNSIDPDEIKIPAMLIQPFAENAIWHGLMHKKEDRCLKIRFSENGDESLVCSIEDNGIGREAAGKINSSTHSGKGISVAEERLKAYNAHHLLKSSVLIEDIRAKNGKAGGTRVTLTLPLL